MADLGEFVAKWLRENLRPLDADADLSQQHWLDNTNYPLWRKTELQTVWSEFNKDFREVTRSEDRNHNCFVKSFMKDESYPTYKHARAINSRTDAFKCRVGPIFKLIEKELFKLDWFIKYVPVRERMNVVLDQLQQEGSNIASTDHESFEAHFTRQVMEKIEFQLYEYMTVYLPDKEWYQLVVDVLGGRNHCVFRDFTVDIDATRMSGEMCTSLGNSFANLMVMLFILNRLGAQSIRGKVEGDDGLFTWYGPLPTPKDFNDVGFTIKMEFHSSLSHASFCGLLADEYERNIITDPILEMLDFGWTTQRYVHARPEKIKALLRCKSLSLAFQYPGCPILQSLAAYGLRMSVGVNNCTVNRVLSRMNNYEKDMMQRSVDYYREFGFKFQIPGIQTRLMVECLYGICVTDQIRIENLLDNKSDLAPINLGFIDFHPDCVDYYERFSADVDYTDNHNINLPNLSLGRQHHE